MRTISWDDDYELADEEGGVYVYVGKHCLVINRNSDGTSVDIYERGAEQFIDSEPLARTYALDADCEGEEEDAHEELQRVAKSNGPRSITARTVNLKPQ